MNKLPWIKQFLTNNHRQSGEHWEQFAQDYLAKHGLSLLDKNFHSRHGEIDLIMKDADYLVFIEVKYRKNNQFGGAISAVSASKQQKLHKTAQFFLHQQGLNEYNTHCRFDVVAIEGDPHLPKIHWLKNAF